MIASTYESQFSEIVARAIRSEITDDEAAWLLSDDVIFDYRTEIVSTKADVEAQILARNADLAALKNECIRAGGSRKAEFFDAKSAHDSWKAGAVRITRGCDNCLTEIKAALAANKRDYQVAQRAVMNGTSDRSDVCRPNNAILEEISAKLDAILKAIGGNV